MSVTLVANPYVDENSIKIRNKNVPWDVGNLYRDMTFSLCLVSWMTTRHINAQTWLRLISLVWSRKSTVNLGRALNPFCYLRETLLCNCLLVCWRESRRVISNNVSSCGLLMHWRVSQRRRILRWESIDEDGWIDHEERIPLFLRMKQSDHDLPYLPLLKYVVDSRFVRSFGRHPD